jgi:hypothetical protein
MNTSSVGSGARLASNSNGALSDRRKVASARPDHRAANGRQASADARVEIGLASPVTLAIPSACAGSCQTSVRGRNDAARSPAAPSFRRYIADGAMW